MIIMFMYKIYIGEVILKLMMMNAMCRSVQSYEDATRILQLL